MAEHLISPSINGAINLIRQMYQKISAMSKGHQLREDLLERIQKIQTHLEKLNNDDDLAARLNQEIKNACQSLQNSQQKCTEIAEKGHIKRFVYSESDNATVENLKKGLDDIQRDLGDAILFALSKKMDTSIAMWSQPGVYPVIDGVSRPIAVDKPKVSVTDEEIDISWNDNNSPGCSVTHYEIKVYENDSMQIITNYNNHCTIGPPTFNGRRAIYTFQVRAINKGEKGKWSEKTIVRYKTAPPNRPEKPTIIPGFDNVEVDAVIPGIDESNGAVVNKLIVVYKSASDADWYHEECSIEETPSEYSFVIDGLNPDTCYSFCIIIANDCGQSTPSESVLVYTNTPIPGKPANFRLLRCYCDKLIVSWDPPENDLFVEYYVLSYKESKLGIKSFKSHKAYNLCTAATKLKPGTEYDLMVFARNKNGQCSKEVRITAKTKQESVKDLVKNFVAPTLKIPQVFCKPRHSSSSDDEPPRQDMDDT